MELRVIDESLLGCDDGQNMVEWL